MNSTRDVAITVRGRISRRLAASFDNMVLESLPGGSRLVGRVSDQAQLHGLLARIRDLGLELESVTTADPASCHPSQGGANATRRAER